MLKINLNKKVCYTDNNLYFLRTTDRFYIFCDDFCIRFYCANCLTFKKCVAKNGEEIFLMKMLNKIQIMDKNCKILKSQTFVISRYDDNLIYSESVSGNRTIIHKFKTKILDIKSYKTFDKFDKGVLILKNVKFYKKTIIFRILDKLPLFPELINIIKSYLIFEINL